MKLKTVPMIKLRDIPCFVCLASILILVLICPILYWWNLVEMPTLYNIMKTDGLIIALSIIWCFIAYD